MAAERGDDARDLLARIADAGARLAAARAELAVLVARWRLLAAGGGRRAPIGPAW